MKNKSKSGIIDLTINPENAQKRGYTYIGDVFNPYEAIKDVMKLAKRNGFRFGSPTKTTNQNNAFGLYKNIKDEKR